MSVFYICGMAYDSNYLQHYGIKGQKWGIRRYQNEDGTLTPAGKARYGTDIERTAAKDAQRLSDAKAAYGEGSGVRRRLLNKEINEKLKNKEYRKAYQEAEKHVDVNRSLKRAERLHKKQGIFVKGRSLTDRGHSVSNTILSSLGSSLLTGAMSAAGSYMSYKSGDKVMAGLIATVGGVSVASIIGKGASDAYKINYYERNKKF